MDGPPPGPEGDGAVPMDPAGALEQAIAGVRGSGLESVLVGMRGNPEAFVLALRLAEFEGLLRRDFPGLVSIEAGERGQAARRLGAFLAPFAEAMASAESLPGGVGVAGMQSLLARYGAAPPQDVSAQRGAPAHDGGGAAGLAEPGLGPDGGGDRMDDGPDDTCARGARFAQASQAQHVLAAGLVARLLAEAGATCDSCAQLSPPAVTRPGVWCCCRRASGERLCYQCDADRHLEAPFCPCRIALVERGHAAAVPQRLWPSDFIDPPAGAAGPVAQSAWVKERGASRRITKQHSARGL